MLYGPPWNPPTSFLLNFRGSPFFFFQAWWLDLPTGLQSGILILTPPCKNDDQFQTFQAHHQNHRLGSPRHRSRPPSITAILTVNSFFTLRRLYYTVVLHSPANTINLFCTLLQNPVLPPLIHALDVNFAMVSPPQNFRWRLSCWHIIHLCRYLKGVCLGLGTVEVLIVHDLRMHNSH